MRYLQHKDHQHHKWRQQRSWISYPDCQGAQDKQLMQYLLKRSSKWKMLQNYWKSQIGMSRHLDSSTTTQMAKILVRCRRPSRSSWTKSVRSSFGRIVVERQFEKILLQHGWEKVSNWECLFIHREKGLFLSVYVDDIKLVGKKQNIDSMWKVLYKEVDLGEPTSFFDQVYLGCIQRHRNKQWYCWELQNHVWIQISRRSKWKITMLGTSVYLFVVLRYGRSCQEMCRTILWVGEQNDSTDLQSINSMLWRPSKKKNWNLLENCQKCALKLFWNVYIWHVLEDPKFYGRWTILHDRSQNGPKLVTNAWIDWFHTFIIHVNTNSIAMWLILQNNADWDCFKTQNLQEILRTQNLRQVEHCAFLKVLLLFQSVGCVRNKLQFRTVLQNQKSSLWTLDWD